MVPTSSSNPNKNPSHRPPFRVFRAFRGSKFFPQPQIRAHSWSKLYSSRRVARKKAGTIQVPIRNAVLPGGCISQSYPQQSPSPHSAPSAISLIFPHPKHFSYLALLAVKPLLPSSTGVRFVEYLRFEESMSRSLVPPCPLRSHCGSFPTPHPPNPKPSPFSLLTTHYSLLTTHYSPTNHAYPTASSGLRTPFPFPIFAACA